jgi:quaternary ammonium compound-resistance protein SugE
MKWIMLVLAGVLEVTWACAMKFSDGFTQLVPSIITAVGYIASALFLSLALKELPLGTAYAMWTGFGIVEHLSSGSCFSTKSSPCRRGSASC